ncbi:LPS export ABC transporter periplasmic protein LptC [Persicobacter psychrovividus]|uniref:LPS export ABC transporter periplasmic protein LptC n=1 Tax=Persicobacter psychrovividus TaxID=387638 RepID=A0ABM7VAQ8_9BACT|nr:LPS export ABC transporter periplasmic protein LptC [Persicobacter psychrovividus]
MSRFHSSTFIVLLLAVIGLSACHKKDAEVNHFVKYEGPMMEADSILTYYSDSARLVLSLNADKQLEYETGDREFPEGLYLEFFNKTGEIEATLRCDYCYYDKEKTEYKAQGDVVVKNAISGEKLNTEELYWNPKTKKVYTDKFVRIESDGQILMGEGLDADQDFTEYRIRSPKGTILLDQENDSTADSTNNTRSTF